MATSAWNATTVQYIVWIEQDKICCDKAVLEYQLKRELNSVENGDNKSVQQMIGLMNDKIEKFWCSAAEDMSTEAIRVILQSIEHNQLVYMLSYQCLTYEYAAIHYCAQYERSDVIALILDCMSEEECNQLLSIVGRYRWIPLHVSCERGDVESVRVMLNHLNRDMRYLLLQMKDYTGCSPLYAASMSGHTDIMKVIHGSVTQAQWSNLLRMKAGSGMTALQMTAFCNKHSSIETIRDSFSNDTWKWLLRIPLPYYNDRIYLYRDNYNRVVNIIDELRTAAIVRSAILITDNTGSLIADCVTAYAKLTQVCVNFINFA